MNSLNARATPTLYADLPASFEEIVQGRMFYTFEGDNIVLTRDDLEEAEASFLKTELGHELIALFGAFPNHDGVILQPR